MVARRVTASQRNRSGAEEIHNPSDKYWSDTEELFLAWAASGRTLTLMQAQKFRDLDAQSTIVLGVVIRTEGANWGMKTDFADNAAERAQIALRSGHGVLTERAFSNKLAPRRRARVVAMRADDVVWEMTTSPVGEALPVGIALRSMPSVANSSAFRLAVEMGGGRLEKTAMEVT